MATVNKTVKRKIGCKKTPERQDPENESPKTQEGWEVNLRVVRREEPSKRKRVKGK